jgi:hypothetical protein
LKIYSVTFLALTDANSSVTSLKMMIFAMSYSLLEGQLSREMIWPSVLRLRLDVSQIYIPQSEEFTDIKNIICRCASPPRCALGGCHACLPLVPVLQPIPHVVLLGDCSGEGVEAVKNSPMGVEAVSH